MSDVAQFHEKHPFRTLLRYSAVHWRMITVTFVLTALATMAALAQPLVAERILSALERGEPISNHVIVLVVVLVCGAFLLGASVLVQRRTSAGVVRQVRRDLVFRLIRLRVTELDRHLPGDLIARVTADTSALQAAATDGLIATVMGGLTVVGALTLMGVLNVKLLGVTLLVFACMFFLLGFIIPKLRLAGRRVQNAIGAVGAALDRTLGAARTVKAHSAETRETDIAHGAVDDVYRAALDNARYTAAITVISGVGVQTAVLVVLGFGGAQVASGEMQLSQLVAFMLYVFFLASPIAGLVAGISTLNAGLGALARIEEVRNLPIEHDVAPVAGHIASTRPPRLVVEGVDFSYPGRPEVLMNVNFTVEPGTQTALVGPSGAGKSTMFALLQRFYDPDTGRISLDGIDITKLPRSAVRQRIAYVEQDSPAMAGTLLENLTYGVDSATEEQLRSVLRATRLDELVDRLDEGVQTEVGSRGVRLSGGERQRLAIARALLRSPQVLLLDEATSALDARNERSLRDAINNAAQQCTVILIAHRLSTVTEVDQIVVMNEGTVQAVGTHQQLIKASALYHELASTQLMVPARVPAAEELSTPVR